MRINGSPAYVQMVQGLIDHQKKSFEGKLKPNKKLLKEGAPEILQIRELLKNQQKALEKLENEKLAKKIARGETITEAEREKLRATDPEKLRKADEANMKRVSVGRRLAQAKTKSEAAMIVAGEKSMASSIYEKWDQELGELYLEAIDKAENEYYQGKKPKPATLKDHNHVNKERLFDVRL